MLKDRLGLKLETGLALLARGTQGAVMLAAALCVAWRLTAEEQGFFFVFLSLGALLQLSDFGVGYASLQTASHLRMAGSAARFACFLDRAREINLAVLSTAAVLVCGLGVGVFSARAGTGDTEVHWAGSWTVFVATVLAAQLTSLELALIEGGRSAVQAWRFRWWQESISGVLLIAMLIGGAGLWSLCAYWGARAVLAVPWLKSNRLRIATSTEVDAVRFDWRTEVWPFQWRIGLSSLSGFLIFQAFNPIVLVEQGPVVAGRFGMSLAMMNMLLLISTVWPLSQISHYVGLIGQRQFAQVRHSFWRMFAASSLFTAVLAGGLFVGLWWMSENDVPFTGRVADLVTTGALLATAVVHHGLHCFAVVLRAERREPLMPISVVGGLLTVLVVWIAARCGGAPEIALANLGCAIVGIAIAFAYYQRFMARVLSDHRGDFPTR